jgi:hypothetical protein
MKKFFQLAGLNNPIPGLFGIEIEAEGQGMKKVTNQYWRTEDDGSLRGEFPTSRAEFVMKAPVMEEEVLPALQMLVKSLPNAEFDFSYRTSVHVHVNVQELTMPQILNMVYTYLLLEEPLMTYCGKARKGNRFCLRLRDAEGMLQVLGEMFKNEYGYQNAGDNMRYSAINMAALNKYGSIEFRGMRGNMDVEVLHTWTKILGKIRTFAMQQPSPKHVLAIIEAKGAVGFMRHVLEELAEPLMYPKVAKDITSSYSISLDLPHSYRTPEEVKPLVLKPIIDGDIPKNPKHGQIIRHETRWYQWEQGHGWQGRRKDSALIQQVMMDAGLLPKPPNRPFRHPVGENPIPQWIVNNEPQQL